MRCERRYRHHFQKPHGAAYSVATAVSSAATGTLPDSEFFHQNRKTDLKYLGIGKTGVRHVRMHRVGAVKIGTGTGAATDRFVILDRLITPDKIVHGALRSGNHAQRAVERIVAPVLDTEDLFLYNLYIYSWRERCAPS